MGQVSDPRPSSFTNRKLPSCLCLFSYAPNNPSYYPDSLSYRQRLCQHPRGILMLEPGDWQGPVWAKRSIGRRGSPWGAVLDFCFKVSMHLCVLWAAWFSALPAGCPGSSVHGYSSLPRMGHNYMSSSVGQALWVPKGSEVKWDFLVSKVSQGMSRK